MTDKIAETVALLRDAFVLEGEGVVEAHIAETAADLLEALARDLAAERDRAEKAEASLALVTAGRDAHKAARDRLAAELSEVRTVQAAATFYIDCEFDGHDGPLLSMAMVRGDGRSLHVKVGNVVVTDPWVLENVMPIMDSHHADLSWTVRRNEVGTPLRGFIGDCQNPVIIADSPVDIGRFCRAISTGEDGQWHSTGYPGMTFIVRNVDCYPTALAGAVRHNAWWDAMALRALAADPLVQAEDRTVQAAAGVLLKEREAALAVPFPRRTRKERALIDHFDSRVLRTLAEGHTE
jgi:hypothetical protein